MIIHPIKPLYNKNSKTLILGSFPSVKSREENFFYGHKQNRFWKVISSVFNTPLPTTIEEKRNLILSNNLALWDVIKSCEIVGSADSTITNVTPNDLIVILNNSNVTRIFVNCKTAYKYYVKYIEKSINIKATVLPSTSPANASTSLEKLIESWQLIKNS
jgi:hypoxanthine-DNA glycosylase